MGQYFNSSALLFCFRSSVSAEPRVTDEQASIWKRNNIYEGIALFLHIFVVMNVLGIKLFKAV